MEMKDKVKCFIDCYIPTETCNLRCHYCYITQKRKFNEKQAAFLHTPAEIRRALSIKRLGGPCLINFCAGGETLLSEKVLQIIEALLQEGHYVMIVTNGTVSKRFDEMSLWPKELLSHLFFKFSYHYLELKRRGWIERFFENVLKMKAAGASFTVEITPTDELMPFIEEVKSTCIQYVGALCHVTVARDERTQGIDVMTDHSWEEYKKIWSQFNSALFDFKTRIFSQKRKEFCYAGAWSYFLNIGTGSLVQCYRGEELANIYQNPEEPLPKKPIGYKCEFPHCVNGHAFLALGDIPELPAPTFAEERNRVCEDGTEWLQPEMKEVLSSRLYDTNRRYSIRKRAWIWFKNWAVERGIRETTIYKTYHRIRGR